jgi:hypothetical protein
VKNLNALLVKKVGEWAVLVILLTGCGYRWQPDYPEKIRPTITVLFVNGDEEGFLTAEIISCLSVSGLVDVIHRGGDYRLEVFIKAGGNETIGFRRDPQKVDGKVRKNLLACEGRRAMAIEAILFRGNSQEIAYGPYLITADVDYDYVDGDSVQDLTFLGPDGKLITVLPFSLGQLESVESAQEAAGRPLYCRVAQKIVDAISSEW